MTNEVYIKLHRKMQLSVKEVHVENPMWPDITEGFTVSHKHTRFIQACSLSATHPRLLSSKDSLQGQLARRTLHPLSLYGDVQSA